MHRAQFFIFLISIPAAPFLSVTDTPDGGWDSGGVPCQCMICLLIYGSNVSKNAGPIELHWVTCRYAMYLRTGMENVEGDSGGRAEWSGIYSTTFWLRLILKNRHRQKLRAHPRAYVLARARWPYLFAPRVLRFVLRLPFLPLYPYRSRSHDFEPALPGAPLARRNIRSEETTPYNTRATFIVMHVEITN